MTQPVPLTINDPTGGGARHAIGVHIVLINDAGKVLLGLRAKSLKLAGARWSTTGVRAGSVRICAAAGMC